MSWVLEHWSTIVVTALSIVGGASVAVKAIAPFTEWTGDDRAARWLDKAHAVLSKLALNG